MGMDITMMIKNSNGGIGAENIFEGRNTEWFRKLQGRTYDDCYYHLPKHYSKVPEAVKFDEETLSEEGYFDFTYINVYEFIKWFEKYHPDLDAGWVTTYDKWRIEKKGYIPDEVQHYLYEEDNINDYHFVEFINPYDCSRKVYNYILNLFHEDDYKNLWLCFYFDC